MSQQTVQNDSKYGKFADHPKSNENLRVWILPLEMHFGNVFPDWEAAWSGRMHSTGNQEWLGNLPVTGCIALGSHSAPCLTSPLHKMRLSAWGGWEAEEQQGRVLVVFLKPAFMQNQNVTVLQALGSSLLWERARAALASSVLRQLSANRSLQIGLRLLSGSGLCPLTDAENKRWFENFWVVFLWLRRMRLAEDEWDFLVYQ